MMQLSRRFQHSRLSLIGVYIAILLLLPACRQNDRTVTFMVFGDPAELAAYEQLVASFTEAYPDVPLLLQHIPSQAEYRQRLATSFSAGEPPDIMLINYRRFATFAEQGGLEPLGPYLDSSELLNEDEFFDISIDSFYFDSQLWCIPQNLSSLVVYYNRDLFAAAKLDMPSDDWSLADFLELARQLTIDTDGDGKIDQYGVGIAPNLFRLAPFIWGSGGTIVDDPELPTRLTLDTPVAAAAFQWFVDLQTVEKVVPSAIDEASQSSENRFLSGTLAMYFNSRRGVPTYRTIDAFEWDVAPLPIGEKPAGILHADAYCMAAKAENKSDAWQFIEFANSTAGQEIIATSGRTVPSLRHVADSPYFLDPTLPPANSRIFIDTTDSLGRVPVVAGWVGVEEATSKEIERAFYGHVSVAEAIEAALLITAPFFEDSQ